MGREEIRNEGEWERGKGKRWGMMEGERREGEKEKKERREEVKGKKGREIENTRKQKKKKIRK